MLPFLGRIGSIYDRNTRSNLRESPGRAGGLPQLVIVGEPFSEVAGQLNSALARYGLVPDSENKGVSRVNLSLIRDGGKPNRWCKLIDNTVREKSFDPTTGLPKRGSNSAK